MLLFYLNHLVEVLVTARNYSACLASITPSTMSRTNDIQPLFAGSTILNSNYGQLTLFKIQNQCVHHKMRPLLI